jgi:hypothetical protein
MALSRRASWLLLMVILLEPAVVEAALFGPTSYLSFVDSPFNGVSLGYFYLEDFEDHAFNTPGVSSPTGEVARVLYAGVPDIGGFDSVDADDGSIDGLGRLGDSFANGAGFEGFTFTFDESQLGSLPAR